MNWFTADLHLEHYNIIKYCNRPFKNTNEMDRILIDNIINKVKKNDTLWVLGDTSFNEKAILDFYSLCKRHNIDIRLIIGNHDKINHNTKSIFTKGYVDIKIDHQHITLCHYPMVVWEKSHYNAWMLYGHVHNSTNLPIKGKMMNVGVDVNNYQPVSFEEVREFMKNQPDNFNLIKD